MEYYDDEMIDNEFENFLNKDKSLAQKRRNDVVKALRKRRIAHSYSLFAFTGWYNNLHQYSKNKIHCSCPMCTAKTNTKSYKSRGPVCSMRGVRPTLTNKRYGKKYYKISDMRKIDRLNYVDE